MNFTNSLAFKLLLITTLAFASCRGTQTNKEEKPEKGPIVEKPVAPAVPKTDSAEVAARPEETISEDMIVKNRHYNDVARLIAGLPQEKGSDLDSMQNWPEFKRNAAHFSMSWGSVKKKRLDPMRKWGATELTEINSAGKDIFYPFCGADFMSVYSLFPNAKTYTMLALERPGALPLAEKFDHKELEEYLSSVKNSLVDIFIRSFFVTRNMDSDLRRNKVNGTLPLISFFMVRTGNTILNVERVRINSEGKIVPLTTDTAVKAINRGVKVTFRPKDSKEIKTLYYFSVDLVDDAMKSNTGLVTYLNDMPACDSYLKSASYLLHLGNFTRIRNVILGKSDHVLQDDSGIPYSYYIKKGFNVTLYGGYEKPINLFKHKFQKDLREQYVNDSANVKPLPFISGYHWGTKNPNLQLASKQKP